MEWNIMNEDKCRKLNFAYFMHFNRLFKLSVLFQVNKFLIKSFKIMAILTNLFFSAVSIDYLPVTHRQQGNNTNTFIN